MLLESKRSRPTGGSGPRDARSSDRYRAVPSRGAVVRAVTSGELDRFLTMVIAQHGMWKLHLHRVAEGVAVALVPETARLDDRCDLGTWLHGGTDGVLEAAVLGRVIDLHARFHRVAGGHTTPADSTLRRS